MKKYNHFAKSQRYNHFRSNRLVSTAVLFLCLFTAVAGAAAQDKTPSNDPIHSDLKRFYAGMKFIVLSSAERMPEKHYKYHPTKTVRSFGQIVGHIADSQFEMCSIALGEKYVARNVEKSKSSKADLIASLKEGFAFCDRAYDGITEESAVKIVNFMGADTTQFGVLSANLTHTGLHYGNLITYMRMKNVVPPTSDPGFFDTPEK